METRNFELVLLLHDFWLLQIPRLPQIIGYGYAVLGGCWLLLGMRSSKNYQGRSEFVEIKNVTRVMESGETRGRLKQILTFSWIGQCVRSEAKSGAEHGSII